MVLAAPQPSPVKFLEQLINRKMDKMEMNFDITHSIIKSLISLVRSVLSKGTERGSKITNFNESLISSRRIRNKTRI